MSNGAWLPSGVWDEKYGLQLGSNMEPLFPAADVYDVSRSFDLLKGYSNIMDITIPYSRECLCQANS